MFQTLLHGALSRIPDYQLVDDDVKEYLGTPFVTGVIELPATFTPGTRSGVARPF
jgi:hypothetical protein